MLDKVSHPTVIGNALVPTRGRNHSRGLERFLRRFPCLGAMLFALGVAFSVPAMAQSPQTADRSACRADAERLCGSVQRGEDRVRKCLRDNKSQLSEACKRALSQSGERERRGQSKN
jgi:hypothetical protein